MTLRLHLCWRPIQSWRLVFWGLTMGVGSMAFSGPGEARDVLRESGIKGGLIAVLGCTTNLTPLRPNESYVVHGLAADAETRSACVTEIQKKGSYGPVSVAQLCGHCLPYTNELVNLLIVENPLGVKESEFTRVLVPGGVVMARKGKSWEKRVKPWPDNIDEWTHFLHSADNNAVAQDSIVGPPGHIQWTAGPLWSRDHDITPSIFAPVSAGGRLFYVQEEGPVCVVDPRLPEKYVLVARDAFNGMPLWKRPMPRWYSTTVIWGHIPSHSMRRLVASRDRVFVTMGINGPVSALDTATGTTLLDYPGTENTSELVHEDGLLVAVIREETADGGLHAGRTRERFRKGYTGPESGGESILVLNATTGESLWKRNMECIPLSLALSKGRVFLISSGHVVCIDARSSTELWRTESEARTLIVHGNAVVTATDRASTAYKSPKGIKLMILSAEDGKELWNQSGDCLPNFNFFYVPVDLFVARNQVWGLAEQLEWNKEPGTGFLLGYDVMTGEIRTKMPLAGAFTAGHHVRCYKGKATENFLLLNKRGIEFLDIAKESAPIQDQWARGACRYGILPCNGLIYTPSHACACYPGAMLGGFHALAPAEPKNTPESASESKLDAALIQGPAYGTGYVAPDRPRNEDGAWATYRHDPARSGSTPTVVEPTLQEAWRAELGTRLSAPVAAGGCVYVAAIDEHRLLCLDADSGKRLWSATVGGRIDSPPTIEGNLVLFGSRDGYCYCLDASNGQLVWSFRVAPAEKLIGSFNQLESAWPLHGSVLVQNSTAYVVAGRSSFVDGGMVVCALDAGSGMVRGKLILSGPDPADTAIAKTAGRMPGSTPDILVCRGNAITMRHVRMDLSLSEVPGPDALSWGLKLEDHFLAGSGFLDDSLFNRTVWKVGKRIDRSQMLVIDGPEVYGLRVYWGISWNCSVFNPGDGYLIFKQDISKPCPPAPKEKKRQLMRIPYERYAWNTRVPVRVSAMVLTGAKNTNPELKRLYVVGQPDIIDENDPLGAFEGRKGAKLIGLSATNGETITEMEMDSPAVWDGLIAYRKKLYVSLQNGSLLCLGSDAN